MLLFMDTDQKSDTGWFGYDVLINKTVPDDKTTTFMRFDPQAQSWVEGGRLAYRYAGKALELALPRRLLGLRGRTFSFDFHWCDHPADLEGPISLCVNGDSAPNRRFNYRCIWSKKR